MTEARFALNGAEAITRLARPQSVAIVGGSADSSKIAGRPVKFLRNGGYDGVAYLVNPGLPDVDGYTSLASVGDLPTPPDAAFVALPANAAIKAVAELAAIGTPVAIVLASGFADGGGDGLAREHELVAAAGTMRLLGPNSLGLLNMTGKVLLTPSDALESPGLEPGPVGFASQSGGIMASLLSRAAARGLGYSTLISTGNEADLEVADCIEFLVSDEATEVIACYLETVRNPERFVSVSAAAAAAGKRIVCFKVGRSEAGARAAVSHTGALAGGDRVFDALFDRAGVLRVRRFSELLEVPAALAGRRRMGGRRIGVLTTTGGAGTLLADACGEAGLELPLPGPDLAGRLQTAGAALDPGHNPIDLTLAGTRPEVMVPVIESLAASEDFDALVVIIGSSGVAQPRLVADPLIACACKEGAKPLFGYASPHVPEVVSRLNRAGVPTFTAPEDCASALLALAPPRTPSAPGWPSWPRADGGRMLNEHEGKELLARFGIASPRRAVAATPTEVGAVAGALREPLAMKVLSAELPHKSAVGGVLVGLSTTEAASVAEELLTVVRRRQPGIAIEGLLLEEMHSGPELLLGMIRDAALGPAIVLGAGGSGAEFADDVVVALPPISEQEATQMITRLRLAPMLDGGRARPAADRVALAAALVAFSKFVEELGSSVLEAEVNPLVVLEEGHGVLALDVLVRLVE